MRNTRMAQQLRILSLQPSLESEDTSVTETGPSGEGVIKTDLEPAQDVPADGASAPGEDENVTATTVEVGERSDLEAAETVVTDSETQVSQESMLAGAVLGFFAGGPPGALVGAIGGALISAYQDASEEIDRLKKELAKAEDKQEIAVLKEKLHAAEEKAGKAKETIKEKVKEKEGGAKPSAESLEDGSDSSAVTGDGDQIVKADVKPVDETPADGAGAPGEDEKPTAKVVEVGERSELEAATTESTDSPVVVASVESDQEADDSSVVTNDGDNKVSSDTKPVDETPADGAGAPGEDEKPDATIVEVGERSDLESAVTEVADSQDLEVSQEGIKGAVKGFAIGTAGVILAPLTLGLSNGAVDAGLKQKRLRLANEINILAKRLADLKNGDVEQAKKQGISVPKETVAEVDAGDVVKSFVLGLILPFYSTYQGHKVEELEIELAGKVAALKLAMAAHGIATESIGQESDGVDVANAAVAAAAAVAEGAAAAAEAAAAAVEATTDTPVADASAEVVVEATQSAEEATEAAVEVDLGEDAAEAELTDLEEGITEGEANVVKYEQAAATLESLIEALDESRQTGGLTPQSARFFQISFESVGINLTGAPFKNARGETAIPSLESFGGTMRRDKATQVSMEAAEGWLKKIMDVLRRTYAQVKEWLAKFLKAVLDKSERIRQRAVKIKAASAKLNGAKTKSDTVEIGSTAGKIAVGTKVESSSINDVLQFAKEAGARNGEASVAIVRVQRALKDAVSKVAQGGLFDLNEVSSAATSGKLRSAVFNIAYQGELGQGYKTQTLPGNVEFVTLDNNNGEGSSSPLNVIFTSWNVAEIRDAVDVNGTVDTLTTYHITEIADAVLKTLDAIKAAEAALEQEAVAVTDVSLPEEVSKTEAKKIKALAWAAGKMVQTQSSSIGKALRYATNVCDSYLDYAAASLKQYETATAE